MSDVLHHAHPTPTQRASVDRRAKFQATIQRRSTSYTEEIARLRNELASALQTASEQASQIAERDNTIARLEQQNRAAREQNIVLEKHFGMEIRVNRIIAATAVKFRVTAAAIKSNRREAWIIPARHTAMYLARRLTNRSLPEIGVSFGGRDHTTILHAARKITEDITNDNELAAKIAELVTELGGDQ